MLLSHLLTYVNHFCTAENKIDNINKGLEISDETRAIKTNSKTPQVSVCLFVCCSAVPAVEPTGLGSNPMSLPPPEQSHVPPHPRRELSNPTDEVLDTQTLRDKHCGVDG